MNIANRALLIALNTISTIGSKDPGVNPPDTFFHAY